MRACGERLRRDERLSRSVTLGRLRAPPKVRLLVSARYLARLVAGKTAQAAAIYALGVVSRLG